MKALKEKRISLRSLWRRGLVILSLFALVFASCGDSSSESSDIASAGPRVVSFGIRKGPANDQYFGQPVDLTGVELRVKYSDGTEGILTDTSKFITIPRVVTGLYANWSTGADGGFAGMPGCFIVYAAGGAGNEQWLSFDGVKVWGILRNDTTDNSGDELVAEWKDPGSYSLGLRLTGTANVARTPVYEDLDNFNFSGLALEADYVWYDRVYETVLKEQRPLSFADVTWKINPSYKNYDANGVCNGSLVVTVGEDVEGVMSLGGAYPTGFSGKGVTTAVLLDKVYTIIKDDPAAGKYGIKLANDPGFKPYFFWQANTKKSWVGRLLEKDEDAKLLVTYTSGETKERLIRNLAEKVNIWNNANPEWGGPWNQYPPDINWDFDILPILYPLNAKSNPEPGITLYYRGATTKVPVDVYTTLIGVSAVSKSGGDIYFDPIAKRDNDIDYGLPGSAGLASLLDVKASYQAYNDPSKQEDIPLEYLGTLLHRWKNEDPSLTEYVPYYEFGSTMTTEEIGGEDVDFYHGDDKYDSAYAKWFTAWKKGKKETITRAVAVIHGIRLFEYGSKPMTPAEWEQNYPGIFDPAVSDPDYFDKLDPEWALNPGIWWEYRPWLPGLDSVWPYYDNLGDLTGFGGYTDTPWLVENFWYYLKYGVLPTETDYPYFDINITRKYGAESIDIIKDFKWLEKIGKTKKKDKPVVIWVVK